MTTGSTARAARRALGLCCALVTLAACGGQTGPVPAGSPTPHHHTPGMRMAGGSGQAAAAAPTPTSPARTATGEVATADGVTGTARVDRWPARTVVTLDLHGLEPGHQYMGHPRPRGCGTPAPGATPDAMAAGVLHLMFLAGADGSVRTVADADEAVDVRSVDLVLADSAEVLLGCVDVR